MAIAALVFALLAACAHAWGPVGHEVVATIAANLLTQNQVANILNIVGANSFADVANWADQVRSQSQYKWSAPLHFINTPDGLCEYNYARDCVYDDTPGFCVAGAITNFTEQAKNPGTLAWRKFAPLINVSLGDSEQAIAVKFLIHFVGDIHQPLHVGFTSDKGGNSIKLDYYGQSTNLHAVWDDSLINSLIENNYTSANQWVTSLTQRVQPGGAWATYAQQWGSCNTGSVDCTTIMASESIKYACRNSYECQPSDNEPCPEMLVQSGMDLEDAYYLQGAPVVDVRIAQAGVRLAALLNYIFPA